MFNSNQHPRQALLTAGLAFIFYFLINYFFLFSLTAPSDPLQYVGPALHPENGFPFLDRTLLWLWIRFIAIFPIPPEEVGGVATLLLSSMTLMVGTWFLAKKTNLLAASIFIFLYLMSPIITGIASYTYPMQLLVFVMLLTLVMIELADNVHIKFFIAGFLSSYLDGKPIPECGQRAATAAVYTVEKYGTTGHSFSKDLFENRWKENFS